MSYTDDPVLRELISCRVKLLLNQEFAFFGNLVARLDLVEENTWCKTAATDGRRMYYNREFIKGLKREELMFLMGHEVLHGVYDHLGRRGSRIPDVWNMANDYIVNYTLVKHGLGKMPTQGLYDVKYTDDMTSEEVYRLLVANNVKIRPTLDMHLELGGPGDDKGDNEEEEGDGDGEEKNGNSKSGMPTLSEDELAEIRADIMSTILQVAQQVDQGNIPAGIQRIIKDFTEPKMNWRQLIDVSIQGTVSHDWSFLRPHRRSFSLGACLPGPVYQDMPEVMVWIDTSGSISQAQIQDFLGEVYSIMETFPNFVVWLGCIDAEVYNVQKFTPENMSDLMEYEPKGGGGNDFPRMFNWMRENSDNWIDGHAPKLMIKFTDGYPCGPWGDPDYCNVIWIIHSNPSPNPPFGTVVFYE